MSTPSADIQVQDIDHLGIVAGIIDQIGLVEEADRLLGTDPRQRVSPGIALKALLLNALGFVSAPLYLFEQFFVGKATEHLLEAGIRPEHLNDDRLGRLLDLIYQFGTTELFVKLAMEASRRCGLHTRSVHLDATSFSVTGRYLQDGQTPTDDGEAKPIHLTYGYSRDRRPDLKQFLVDFICSNDGEVPLYLRVADGNEADKAVFAQLMQQFRAQWQLDALFVADGALYSADNLQQLAGLRWVSRVGNTIREAKEYPASVQAEELVATEFAGYRIVERTSAYGGVPQRWIVVESQERKTRELAALEKKLIQLDTRLGKELERLTKVEFACEADAVEAAERFSLTLHWHLLGGVRAREQTRHTKAGRPTRGSQPEKLGVWRLAAELVRTPPCGRQAPQVVETEQQITGRFILATNVLEQEQLSAEGVLAEFKSEQQVEGCFRFLKDPLFFTSSVFLKSPERVAALACVMGLALLVYNLGQRQLRQALAEAKATVKNQVKKPTATPTLRWIFQCFQAVQVLAVAGVVKISNLNEERQRILRLMGGPCCRYYLLD